MMRYHGFALIAEDWTHRLSGEGMIVDNLTQDCIWTMLECVQVQECNSNRTTMLAEAAETSTAAKVLVVKVLMLSCHATSRCCFAHLACIFVSQI